MTIPKSMPPTIRWIAPPALALLLYWPGLIAWFQKDDFAWLGLYSMIHSPSDLWTALFQPYAQGTVRTISERAYFTILYALFGMNALPYHALSFTTQFANLTLINLICARLTGSTAAGFWAAILWVLNANLGYTMAWVAIYHQILCAFVLLLALYFLMRFAETGERKYLAAQWVVFLIGFGVEELNVVYPALAAAYALCCARHVLRFVLPMFIPAIVYTAIHLAAAPLSADGPYKMHWDFSVLSTLWLYWKTALGPAKLINLGIQPSPGRSALAAALTIGFICFLLRQIQRRRWLTVFFASWFFIVLSPLLPLRDHFTDYYLTIPLIGLSMWGAWAIVCGWRQAGLAKAAAILLAAVYLIVNIPLARSNVNAFYKLSVRIQTMTEAVVQQHQLHPDQPVMLTSVEPDLFWSAIVHKPFRLYGMDAICLDPASRPGIESVRPGQQIDAYFQCPANAAPFSLRNW